jgi:HAD superfamily hydrolase (TIGR01509 family)
MIKALVFDLGNVVLTDDHPYNTPSELKEFCEYFGVTMDNIYSAFEASFPDYSLGRCSEDDFWKKYLYLARANKEDLAFAKEFWRKNQKENENMLPLLKRLKGKYRLAALTTIPREWLAFKRKKFHLDEYFEFIISSGEYGMKKPEVGIYKIVVDKLNLPPNETVFIDNKEQLLPSAQEIGMQTIFFRGQKDLEEKLSKLLQ